MIWVFLLWTLMPTISVFYGIVIQMFWRDHAPPHFHALYAEHEALIDLRDLPRHPRIIAWSGNDVGIGVGRGTSRWTDGGLEPMQPTETPEGNRTPEVEPAIRHTVPWRVTSVAALPDSRLRVTFVDGVTGEVDMRLFLSDPRIDGTVFEPLRDPAVFAQARVVLGAIQWPNGADIAPDAMYDAIRQYGLWVLD
jgi:Protein of unknown function (DUF2442)/Domain of unknown function (DUF4160)